MKEADLKIIKEVAKKNNFALPDKIKEFESGQINNVYSLGDDYVIKIESDVDYIKGLFNHQVDLESRLLKAGAKVPKIIDCGKDYLLLEKLQGDNLVNDWYNFSDKQKENFIEQLVEQLKIYHSLTFNNYSLDAYRGKEFSNYQEAMAEMVGFDQLNLNKLDSDTLAKVDLLKDYFKENLNILDETGTAVLVHNDIQFENIFYQDDKITGIIDFDWSCQAPRDYELGKIVDFFLYSHHYVRKSLEKYYRGIKLKKEWTYFKKYYPEIVATDNLLLRLKYYFIILEIWTIRECQRNRWEGPKEILAETREKIDFIFETGGEFDNFILN